MKETTLAIAMIAAMLGTALGAGLTLYLVPEVVLTCIHSPDYYESAHEVYVSPMAVPKEP